MTLKLRSTSRRLMQFVRVRKRNSLKSVSQLERQQIKLNNISKMQIDLYERFVFANTTVLVIREVL